MKYWYRYWYRYGEGAINFLAAVKIIQFLAIASSKNVLDYPDWFINTLLILQYVITITIIQGMSSLLSDV